jgi:hypothetical protein
MTWGIIQRRVGGNKAVKVSGLSRKINSPELAFTGFQVADLVRDGTLFLRIAPGSPFHCGRPKRPSSRTDRRFYDVTPTTLYAARGRPIPFNSNSPTGSTLTAFSTATSTRALTSICPGLASSQSRDATLDTVPMAA